MKKYLFFIFLGFSAVIHAQTVLDNNPTSLKWNQINTVHFRVLFPQGFEREAQRMANTMEQIHTPESRTMGTPPRKITVLLQNQSSVSNAFVSITPRRSEFYTMPSQNYNFLGTNDWLNLLASHEYRHVVQYQHATRGFNKLFYYLFGANTLSAMSHAAAPEWFWEGDAVATETAFTHSGRGRIPNFDLQFKTNLMEGRTFNYHKQYLRSYKHNIPDHYVLGFRMISYLRKRTNDPDIWGKITARAWNVPFMPFTFSSAIKKESGLYVTGLYRAMAADLKKEWQQQIDSLQLTPFERINPRSSNTYTSYFYPQPLPDGSVLAMKKGIGNIEQFVRLKDGKEKKMFTLGFINDTGMLSADQSKVVWNEYGYDPRWTVRNYTVIKTFDYKTRTRWRVGSRRERFAGAALSPDGTKIITVRSGNNYATTLVVLDFSNGTVLKEFPNPENYFYSMPRWSEDGKKILALKTTPEGRTISWVDFDSGSVVDLLPVSQENIGHPVNVGNYVLYNSPVTGIDNIFVLDLNAKIKYQVTSSKYGAYNPAVSGDGKTLYYNEQVRDGLDVVQTSFNPALWKPYQTPESKSKSIGDILAAQEGMPNLLDSIPQQKYIVNRYSKLKGMINPYSWGGYVQNNFAQVGVGIVSQDVLSTTAINLGYQFDIAERTGLWKAAVSYQGLFPIVDLSFSQGNRSVNEGDFVISETKNKKTTDVLFKDVKFKWTEQNVEGGLRIPLNLTQSKYQVNLSIGNAIGLTHVTNFNNSITTERFIPAVVVNDTIRNIYTFYNYIGNGNLVYNHFTVSATRLLKTSRRDIYSKWGQAAYFNYYNTPYGGDYGGGLFSFLGYLYFPGLMKHHSLNGYAAYQSTLVSNSISLDYNDYIFRNTVPVPRGQSVNRFSKFYSAGVNYSFPLWYPDIAIGPLLYIQRLRINLFADYGLGTYRLYDGINKSYLSVGSEVKFDFNIFRFLPQLNMGVRYSKGINPAVSKFEILVGAIPF